jgi:hypothetical protein
MAVAPAADSLDPNSGAMARIARVVVPDFPHRVVQRGAQSRSATKKCLPLQVCTPRARIKTGDVRGVFLEELLEFIIKTYCTLVGLGARFCCDFQRF